jgi:hypothetical protein
VVSPQLQQDTADSPASKEEVEKYLEVMHSREMMAKMVDAMAKPMHQMMHDQYEKDKDKLSADFEARMNKVLDDYLKSFPWDEILQSMVPVYQKHFTKGDVDHLVAFYSTPTGQKLIREMPAITAEAMQVVLPIVSQKMEAMTRDVQQQVAEMTPILKQQHALYCSGMPGYQPLLTRNAFGSVICKISRKALVLSGACW